MSVKEKYLRRLLTEAEFYMNNIDGDDPQDLVGDAVKAGSGKNPIDAAILAEENKAEEDSKGENKEANNATTGEAKFVERIEEAEKLIKDNLFDKETFRILSRECIILYIELAVRSKKRDEQAEKVLNFLYEHTKCEDQFYCRALFSTAIIEFRKVDKNGLKAEDNLKQTMKAWEYIEKALGIIIRPENKLRYEFLIYNAALVTYQVLRPLNKPGWSKNFIAIVEKISNLLEEKDDADFNLRIRYLSCLSNCYLDAEKKPEGLKFHDKLYELTKKVKECSFQEVVFRNRLHIYRDNNGQLAAMKKDAETGADPKNLKALCVIQQIKSGVIPENQVEKELTTVMAALSPAAVSLAAGNSGEANQAAINKKLNKFDQDRMAEAGRMAIRYNLVVLCEGSCNVIARSTQGSLRAKIWTEYNKAELTLKKTTKVVDPLTGMKLSLEQQMEEEYERRIEALKILERAMITNRRLMDADVIIEGCVLIWNTSIPLLKPSTRSQVYKPFTAASNMLETIQANESKLRVCFFLELAKFEIEQDFISKAEEQIRKAMLIDYSLARDKLQIQLNPDEEPGNFQREFERVLKRMKKSIDLRLNIYGEPESAIEQMILGVEKAKSTNNMYLRETLIDKVLKQLKEYGEPVLEESEETKTLSQEEKDQREISFKKRLLTEKKQMMLIAGEIASLAFDQNLIDLAFEAGSLCTKSEWDPHKDTDLVITQCKTQYIIAQCYVEMLLEEEIEIGFNDLITITEDQDEREFTEEDNRKYQGWKIKFVEHIQKGVKLAMSTLQPALIFRGAIIFWDNYLPIFKRLDYYDVVLKECVPVMQECFEGMNNTFITSNFGTGNIDYNLSTKLNVFTNFSHIYCRIQEKLHSDESLRVCNLLLEKHLPPHLRKAFDTIKTRITKQAKAPEKGGGAPAKGKQEAAGPELSQTEIISAEVIGLLELIAVNINTDKNSALNMIKDTMDKLNQWKPNDKEEIELELHAELWCRLGRLSIMLKTTQGSKISLYCADKALNGVEKVKQSKTKLDKIPKTRLRWYSVAEGLYGESIAGLVDERVQDKESVITCCQNQINHFVAGCEIASKASLSFVLVELSKLMWNALLPMLDSAYNRKKLIEPMAKVHELLLSCKENSDPDFLVLFYHGLFTCITEQKEWKLGEKIVDEAFTYVPQTHQKVLWEAKAMYLSKLGKNVLNAISNMKEGDASLQAKVWVKLAKIFSQPVEQHMAFNKAIELMTKEESVEVVEVLIDYAEWLYRNQYPTLDVEDQLLLAVDVLLDIEPGWEDEEEEHEADDNTKTLKSKKSKGSRASRVSKAKSKVSKVSRKTGKTIKKSVGGKSGMSKASKRTSMSRTTTKTKKTKTALSRRENEDPQPAYLNVSHFDKLFRIHSMLSYISYEQREIALDAQFFIIKIWELSYKSLNAFHFLDKHRDQAEKLGFNDQDPDARNNFYNEVFTNPDVEMPQIFELPESPEGWIDFEPHEEFLKLCEKHEDKNMVAKWAFQKPEITIFHIGQILNILEVHYLHIQMIPILKFAKLFCTLVLENAYYSKIFDLKLTRIYYNFGSVKQNDDLAKKMQELALTEAVKQKLIQENTTGGIESKAELSKKEVNFPEIDQKDPFGIEKIKTHEIWKEAAKELIKFGDYLKAKELIVESSFHSRILKEQNNYADSFNVLATIAELEGLTASSIKLDMYCQTYARDLRLICNSISKTLRHLIEADKAEVSVLMSQSLELFKSLKQKTDEKIINPELSFAMQHVYLDYAIYVSIQIDKTGESTKQKKDKLGEVIIYLEDYETLVQQSGTRIEHIIKCLQISKLLYSCLDKNNSFDESSIKYLETRLERGAKLLLKAQEYLVGQVSLLPSGINSPVLKAISHPLKRLLGVIKLRLAQANSEIGIFRGMMKTQMVVEGDTKKNQQIIDQWMEVISKQIDAQAKAVKISMSIYEKSIILLNNAMNLLTPECDEYLECIVEVAKCKRLLAVNKKHLRSVWRQDAEEINEALNQSLINKSDDIEDEFEDVNANYKEEALKSFIEILSNEETMRRVIAYNSIDKNRNNLLATLSLEYAELKGNLNKEQCFASLALYQFAISRQQLSEFYFKACDSKHPDVLRRLQVNRTKEEFKYFSSPVFPRSLIDSENKLVVESNSLKTINASFNYTEEIKNILPHSSAYLILQFSSNMQSLYVGFCKINKDRKFDYYLTKLTLSDSIVQDLKQIKQKIVTMKNYLYKTPITIQEDLDIIEKDAEEELLSIIEDTEEFFKPVFAQLNELINPEIKEPVAEGEGEGAVAPTGAAAAAAAAAAKKGKEPAKPDPKKGVKDELAKYESNLPLPTSGIESIVLLLDSRLSSLPIEACEIFSKIPVITRDFSLHLYTNRLTNLGHKAELHNNQGISKDNLSYIYDIPSTMYDKFKSEIITEHTKLVPGSQWKGVDTKDHIPSDGEWQRMLKTCSLFTYFSMTCLLHVYPPHKLAETSSISHANAAVIFDRMNSFKPLINKEVLTSKHFSELEQPEQTAALLSSIGMNSVILNQWSICPEENFRIYKKILNETGVNGKYIGASFMRHEETVTEVIKNEANKEDEVVQKKIPRKAIYRLNTICYGVPLNRIN